MERWNDAQRAMLAAALRKEAETVEKASKEPAKAHYLELHGMTGAKTFEVPMDAETNRGKLGTVSVATRGAGYVITDFEAFADGAADAGQLDTILTVPPEVAADVFDALERAGLTGAVQVREVARDKWQEQTAEVAGRLVWCATGEPVQGVEWDAGTKYVTFRPRTLAEITAEAKAILGAEPLALLEGGKE